MGKAKKGRKGAKDAEDDSDVEIETQRTDDKNDGIKKSKASRKTKETDTSDAEDAVKISKSASKSKKDKKKVTDDSDDSDTESNVNTVRTGPVDLKVNDDAVNVSGKGDSDSDGNKTNVKVRNGQKVVDKSDSVNESRTKESGGKKSKKAKRRQDDSDEDIEKVLAELELEYSGGKKDEASKQTDVEAKDETTKSDKQKKKTDKPKADVELDRDEEDDDDDGYEEGGGMKTAAQKKKEKKERDKQKKQAAKKQDVEKKVEKPDGTVDAKDEDVKTVEDDRAVDDGEKDPKKKKKKLTKAEEKDGKAVKGPGKKTIAAMQEALKKIKEEEERVAKQEAERLRREDDAENARLEQVRLDIERKEKKKKKEKERKERLKAEGKLLTQKQKADRARAQALIDSLKAKGLDLPDVGERKPRLGTRIKPQKLKQQTSTEKDANEETKETSEENAVQGSEAKAQEEATESVPAAIEEPLDDVKDAWDAESSEEDDSEEVIAQQTASKQEKTERKKKEDEEETSESDEESDDSSSGAESDDVDENDHRTDAERRRDKAKTRIEARRVEAEKNKSLDNLRAAVVCVLGHVDTGKTKILDKLRRTNVQDGEAGGITQQIGATNVPIDAIKEQVKIVKGFAEVVLKIPGLLIIDTPGHESFSNLRSRGSSLCDIAILVVDIMHGLEPQTIESINLLKTKKTPFIVALNKIDRLYDWQTMNRKDIRDVLKSQASNTQLEFEQRTKEVVVQFAEQGLNAALFYENPDIRTYVSLVPTSAVTGEGMGNLLALIVESCQNMLAKRLMYSEELQATVLEVKAIPGLGTTIDAILVNGTLREGDTMLVAGTDGPIVTQIRSLLMPQPMRELRVKNAYLEYKEIKAAQGVKIAAKELEKAIAGLNLLVAQKPDEVEILRSEIAKELRSALSSIKLQERGVYVQASTLGSLEALLEFLKASKIPYSGIRIGPVVKKDVMKASIMLEHESQYATILAFDVKIERDAQDLADSLGVKIFQADIIYHLFDKFMAYREELKQKKREEFKHIAVFPCKLKVLPQFIFNSRDPIVVGVIIEAGIVREGTPICVPSKEFVELGIVTSIENNHKNIDSARKGMEVCIKIEPIPGESPKMFGRHFDETDFLISKISRQSIDACKDYFRDDLLKSDWQLMVELKKLFEIL